MKKFSKLPKKSPQQNKRTFVINLIKNKIRKQDVLRIGKISERTFYRYKLLIKRRGFANAAERKVHLRAAIKLTKARKISIMNTLRHNPFQSTQELADKFHGRIHRTTISRYLTSRGFQYKRPTRRFHLLENDYDERLNFAKSLRNFVGMAAIIFVDESSFWLGDDNRPGWFHKDEENPLSIERHGGKVNVCAGISCYGKVFINTFRVNMKSSRYSAILRQQLIPQANRMYPYGWWLAQDGNPSHHGDADEVIANQVPYQLEWPARSPDLSPLENVWGELKRRVRKRIPETVDQLENYINEEWRNFPNNSIQNYCESFEERLKAVIKAKGGMIKY